jgi:beta-N-acetylhexosaminidase
MCKIDLIRLQLQNSTPPMRKKVSMKFLIVLSTVVLLLQPAFAQISPESNKQAWIDSVFQTLNTEEKIGQLIMVRVPSNSTKDQENLIAQIRSYRIGGAIIMKGGVESHARFVNKIQKTARVPMFFGLEATAGVGHTIDSILTFPNPLALSAVKNDSLLQAVGKEIAGEMKTLGFQMNFILPSKKSQTIFASPGSETIALFEREEKLADGTTRTIYQGSGSQPGSGLRLADISGLPLVFEKKKQTDIPAFQSGNDIIIDPQDISIVFKKLKKDLKKANVAPGNIPLQQQLDAAVKKILAAKYDAGLAHWQPVSTENLVRRLNSLPAYLLQHEVTRKSITLIANQANTLPIQSLENKRFASITIGKDKTNEFNHTLSKYAPFDHYTLSTPADSAHIDLDIINKYDYVVMGVYPMESPSFDSLKTFLEKIQPKQRIICHFGDPSQLNYLGELSAAIAAYSDNPVSERVAAQMIFGAMTFEGELPVSINHSLIEGTSLTAPTIQRFSYVIPEEAGMDSKTLDQISYIVKQAIDSAATPGCHVFVAHKGKVVFDRSYGSFTYDKKIPVTDETLYDLASITKVAATLQAVMFLQEKGTIDVNKKASVYLPELRSTNKKDITIKDMLLHQSGLLPFIPMWPNTTQDKKVLLPYYYSNTRSNQYSLQVAPELFAAPVIQDSAWQWVLNSKMGDRTARTPYPYRYSDMASMIFQHLVEKVINQPMNEFLEQQFYEPLGANTLGFRPLERFDVSRVAPTEIDTIYRKQLIHGTVHDERAALLGGVAGHAGLFGNANDLGKLGQMLLNGGTYGGVRFFKQETVDLFTAKQYENSRRGLGWDKPTVGDWNGPTTELASPRTFGHTGFTGTCIWVDPEFDLVYVFLSNRVWPDRSNKLLNANIRPRIQEVIYKSIFNYCQFEDHAKLNAVKSGF